MILELNDYEIENLLKALDVLHYEELRKDNWESQFSMNGQHYYTATKESEQIKSTINNIKRQLEQQKNIKDNHEKN